MVKRCDSVDALMYAYYEMMRKKEENQMLEKNKDYVEFTLQYTSVDWARSKDCPEVCLKGYSDFSFPGVPIMDVVCNEFDHKVVVVSKRDFDRLQADDQHYRELANQWEENYKALSKLVGFSSVEEIQDYLTNEAECDTLHEAISKLKDQVKYTCDEWYSANSRNNSWKAAAECNSPKELIEKLNLLRDDISGRSTVIEHQKRTIEEWQKATGCLRPEDISAESMVSKSVANEIESANEELWSENKKCEKRIEALQKEIKIYSRTLNEWKEATGCPGPIAAKALIESGMAYEHGYHEAQKENRKLTEEVDSWKNVTGYSIPEDYLHARISGAFHTPFDYTSAWQKATGCDTPEAAKERIKALNERIDESEAVYNHLLMLTGFESEGEIEDALDRSDHGTLRKALVDYEFDYESLLKLTGYKSEQDIRATLTYSKQFVYETMRELINSLERKAKFTDSNWETATGFSTPEKCSSYIDRLEKKLEDIKNLTEED